MTKAKNNNWSRRRFTKAILSAQALIASGVLTLPASCLPTPESPFTASEKEVLKLVMDEIIPANKIMPSASTAGGIDYIITILKELPELTPLFKNAIKRIDQVSQHQRNDHFSSLESKNRVIVLKEIENTDSELFNVVKDFTYESYYTNESIHQRIGYIAYSTGSSGPSMEPFDEQLLERVKNLSPMYTNI